MCSVISIISKCDSTSWGVFLRLFGSSLPLALFLWSWSSPLLISSYGELHRRGVWLHESREGMCRVLGSGSPARVCRMGDCALLAVEPTGYSDNAQRISSTKFAPYKPPASLLLPPQCDPGTCRALVPSHQQGMRAGPMPGSCGASPQKGVGIKEKQVSSQQEQGDWERSQSGDAREQQS